MMVMNTNIAPVTNKYTGGGGNTNHSITVGFVIRIITVNEEIISYSRITNKGP